MKFEVEYQVSLRGRFLVGKAGPPKPLKGLGVAGAGVDDRDSTLTASLGPAAEAEMGSGDPGAKA